MPVVQLQMLPWHLYTEVHCFEVSYYCQGLSNLLLLDAVAG